MAGAAATELRLDTPRGTLAARRHHAGATTRVLALHGWLDNAMSFEALAGQLPDLDLVALDLPGHGHSAHRPPGAWYHYIDYLDDVAAALQALGWERYVLLGHSLGGAVASIHAAVRPQQVERLVLIEALGPLGARPGQALETLRRGLDERAAWSGRPPRRFDDLEVAVQARLRTGELSEASARALVARNVRAVDGGWEWRSDPRLKLASPLRIHEDTIREWLTAIECPTLLVAADPSPPYFDPQTRRARCACVTLLREVVLPGHHHLHMDDPLPVADAIRAFLA